MIRTISDISPVGPIIVNKHFSVFTEVSARTGQQENDEASSDDAEEAEYSELSTQGRIDILIQTDDAVVGVENKFGADFQKGQPGKYFDLVRTKAKQLGEGVARNIPTNLSRPCTRAPEEGNCRRDQETENYQINCLPSMGETSGAPGQRAPAKSGLGWTDFLVEELEQFVIRNIGSFDIERLVIHLDNPWQPGASAVVREFFTKVIWNLIDQRFRERGS